MVDVRATNAKLRGRLVRLLVQATGAPADRCAAVLADADGQLPVALVSLLGGVDVTAARAALGRGSVRAALARLSPPPA